MPPTVLREEGLTESDIILLDRCGKKYMRLVKEFEVLPSEAVRSLLNELNKEGVLVTPLLRDRIYDYLAALPLS